MCQHEGPGQAVGNESAEKCITDNVVPLERVTCAQGTAGHTRGLTFAAYMIAEVCPSADSLQYTISLDIPTVRTSVICMQALRLQHSFMSTA